MTVIRSRRTHHAPHPPHNTEGQLMSDRTPSRMELLSEVENARITRIEDGRYIKRLEAELAARPDAPTPTPAGDNQREALAQAIHDDAIAHRGIGGQTVPDAEPSLGAYRAASVALAWFAARPSAPTVTPTPARDVDAYWAGNGS